jgi:hypothetical protein
MESCIIGKNNETMAWESKFGLLWSCCTCEVAKWRTIASRSLQTHSKARVESYKSYVLKLLAKCIKKNQNL